MAMRQPAGVVLGIAPWNAPVILGMRAIAMPLACGNTVVLKASETVPAHARADRRGAARGRPARRASSTSSPTRPRTPPRVVEALIAHPAVRRINFTGSTAVGRIIAEIAGRAPEAGAARTRRQGAADRARRCRPRRGGQRRGLRRLHESGPDLHVDRADHRRREGRRRVRRASSRPRPRRCRPAIRARATSCWARWSSQRRRRQDATR